MKSLIALWGKMADDLAIWCSTSTILDRKTVEERVKHEGLSFLTITLPSFGKEFEKSLEDQQVAPTAFRSFSKSSGLPKFLSGFLKQVFDAGSGVLLNDPDVLAIQSVRQLCGLFSKIELDCSDRRVQDAFDQYIQCESDIASFTISEKDLYLFRSMSMRLYRELFLDVDRKIFNNELIPRHGPGATADNRLGNEKFLLEYWPQRLQDVFPWEYYLCPSPRFTEEIGSRIDIREPGSEIPVKVLSVPKTMKTPRIIAKEPTCMMFMQQALSRELVRGIEQDDFLNDVIGFRDQTPNQNMARIGSLDGSLATLDLSEASDRVSNQLVEAMTGNFLISKGLQATRSQFADVPGHGIIPLSKFASMGSALTFPIEAMVFLTIVLLSIESELGTTLTRSELNQFRARVRVYGDDIIVPAKYVRAVITGLEAFGLKVNVHKSFWNGKFRESCGKEFYDGVDVSIVKFRRLLPASPRDASQLLSLLEFRNLCYYRGYWHFTRYVDSMIRERVAFPIVESTSPGHGRASFLDYQAEKWDSRLHRPLVRAVVDIASSPVNILDGPDALLKVFLQDSMFIDENHLERSGRPKSVYTKTRWVTPF